MPHPTTLKLAAGVSALALAAAAPNGKPQNLPPHKAPHAAPVSNLAPLTPKGHGRPYGGTPIDVLTFHYDNNRTGWNPTETDLTPASVSSSKFGLLATLAVDGNVFAQPLVVSGYVMPDGSTHDVLIVATGHNTIYAYDAQTYATLWQVSLGTPQASGDVGCGDIKPEYGVSSTPVIVRTAPNAATLYVVAATEPSKFEFRTMLHALDIGTGQDTVPPAEISPSAKLQGGGKLAYDPQNQYTRAGLAANGGTIYMPVGSHCDNNPGSISGWMLAFDTSLKPQGAFHTIEKGAGYELASIWMSGFAPAVDATGNVLAVTGNGAFGGGKNWGESALKLTPALDSVADSFTPVEYKIWNANDTDFGSGGLMLLPAVQGQTVPPLAVAAGKSGTLYLLDQTKLGGKQPHDRGALAEVQFGGGIWGGPAYYAGPNGPTVFIQGDSATLRAYSVATTGKPGLNQTAQGTTHAGYGGSMPVVSSNGATNGVVWLIRRSDPITLEAYDAASLGDPIFSANIGVWSNPGQQNAFLTASEANGRVYATGYKNVYVFGLSK